MLAPVRDWSARRSSPTMEYGRRAVVGARRYGRYSPPGTTIRHAVAPSREILHSSELTERLCKEIQPQFSNCTQYFVTKKLDSLSDIMTILKTLIAGGRACLRRSYATSSKYIESTRDNDTGIEIISMAKKPVNSLNTELLSELKAALLEAQNSRSKGVVLTSSLPTVFCAGLDIMEMYTTDKTKLTNFWQTLQDTWLTIYSLPIPIATAINGSSPAGGCLCAISTEYRVMVEGKHTIGLNETQLGIVAPKWFRDVYSSIMGHRQAELALLRGSLFKPEKALQLGLVDELAKDKTEAIEKCKKYILFYDNIPSLGRSVTKLDIRNDLIQWMKENKEADIERFVTYVQTPKIQAGLKFYIEYLKQKQQ